MPIFVSSYQNLISNGTHTHNYNALWSRTGFFPPSLWVLNWPGLPSTQKATWSSPPSDLSATSYCHLLLAVRRDMWQASWLTCSPFAKSSPVQESHFGVSLRESPSDSTFMGPKRLSETEGRLLMPGMTRDVKDGSSHAFSITMSHGP